MSNKAVIVLGKTPFLEKVEGREKNVINGDPITNAWKYFVHPSGQMNVGIWDCQAGQWEIESHPNNELCVILEGEVNVTDETGASHDFKPGDAFVLPEGMKAVWTVKKYVKKIFVVVFGLEQK